MGGCRSISVINFDGVVVVNEESFPKAMLGQDQQDISETDITVGIAFKLQCLDD